MKIVSQKTLEEKETGKKVPIKIMVVGNAQGPDMVNTYMSNFGDWSTNPHGQHGQVEAWGSDASDTYVISTLMYRNMSVYLRVDQITNTLKKIKEQIDREIFNGNIPSISINLNVHGGNRGDTHEIELLQNNENTPKTIIDNTKFFSTYTDILEPIIQEIYEKANIEKLGKAQAQLIKAEVNEFLFSQAKKIISLVSPDKPMTDEEKRDQLEEAKKWNLGGINNLRLTKKLIEKTPKDKNTGEVIDEVVKAKSINEAIEEIAKNASSDIEKLKGKLETLVPQLKELNIEAKRDPENDPNHLWVRSVVDFQYNKVKKYTGLINTSQSLGVLIAKELGLAENQLRVDVVMHSCHAGAAVSMLEDESFPPGSTLFAPVNKTQVSLESDTTNTVRNSSNFIGTNDIRLAVRAPLEHAKNAKHNISSVLAIKNKEGKVEIYDFQALLPEFMERVTGMDDDAMNVLEEKFVRHYSPNDPDFRFNHLERILRQIKNVSNKYEISPTDLAELSKLLDGKKIDTLEYIKISNEFYDTHQKIRRIKPSSTWDVDNPDIPYAAARTILLPIFLHAAENLGRLGLADLFNSNYSAGNNMDLLRKQLPDMNYTLGHMILKTSQDGTVSAVNLSRILNSLRNQIIEKYMDAIPNPLKEARKLTIDDEFHHSLKDQFKNTPEGKAAELALYNLESILRGDIPVENSLFNMRDLQGNFNENFSKGEQVKARELFAQLRDFRRIPTEYDLEDILDMRAKKDPKAESLQKLYEYLVTVDFESMSRKEIAEIFSIAGIIPYYSTSMNPLLEKLKRADYTDNSYDHLEPDSEFIQKITEFLKSDFYKNADENQKKGRLSVIVKVVKNPYIKEAEKLLDDLENAMAPDAEVTESSYQEINPVRRIAFIALAADKHDEILEKLNEARAQGVPSLSGGKFGSAEGVSAVEDALGGMMETKK